MSAAPSGVADPAASVFFAAVGFERVVVLAIVRVLVTPDPDEPLSILSSPAPGLPFLWLFAIAKHVINRLFHDVRTVDTFNRSRNCFSISTIAKNAAPTPISIAPSASVSGRVSNISCMKGA